MLQGNIPQQAEQYAKKCERRKVWHRIVMTLACIVVFCTTYALILPAITMERAPSCGLEEHQHTELCYKAKLICGFDEAQPAAHTHSEGCYEQQQILVCGREESAGHIHSDSCIYVEQTLTCAQEHEHTPECYTASRTYVCGMAEGEGAHTHSQECYETRSILICTTPEQQPHVHTDACYETVLVCQKEEHVHSDECYPSSGEETTEPSEEDTEATEETTDPSEEATEETEEETEPEEEIEVPELEPYVTGTFFTDTVYDAAADHFDTVMHVSFRVPVSVISAGELYECNYQLPGKLSPRADAMWGVSNFHFGTAYSSSAARAGAFRFTYEGNHCLCVLDFDRNAVTGDVVEGNFQFAAEISPNALQENGTILLILSNGVGVSIPAPEMPTPETEPTETTTEATEETTEATEETTEAIEETTEATEETTEAIEETTEATEETTEATEETTEATEETTEATEETTEPTVGNIKDAILGFIGDKLQMDGSGMGASGYEMTDGMDETEATEETTGDDEIMPLADPDLPVTKLSGSDTKYDPATDLFTTNVRIDFQFNANTGKPTAGTVYTYTYPAGMVVPDDIVNKGSQALYDGTKYAGTYQFIKNSDSTYSVQIIFNEQYISESGDTITGYVQFEGSFGKEAINEKGDIVVGGDSGTVLVPGEDITYPSNETESYNIDVSKSGTWVQDGDELVYTVYVRTVKGTPDPINFTDSMTLSEGLTLGDPTVTVEKGTSIYYYHDWEKAWAPTDQNDWTSVSGITPSYSAGKLTISLPQLTVTNGTDNSGNACVTGDVYKITYTYPITDQTVAIVTASNGVTVSATDSTKGQTVTDSDGTTVRVDKDFEHTLNKYGQVASDKPGYIKWTVTINSNQVDIAGAVFTDLMLGLVENTTDDIEVSPNGYFNLNKDANGKITSITFAAAANDVNKNTYTITYYTPVEESWDGTTVSNTATFDPTPGDDGDEKEATYTVTVSGVQMNKWGQFDGVDNKIHWNITVNAGGLDIAGAALTDEMFTALSDQDFTIKPSTGYSFTKDSEGKITGITFTEVADGKNTQIYTITYSTAVTRNEGDSTTAVTNTATLSPGDGKDGTPIESESTVKPDELQLTKSGSYDSYNQRINWTIDVNASKLNIAGAVLTDEMFSQLTSGDIRIQYDDTWGNNAASTDYSVVTDESGKISSITFNAIAGGKNNNHYVITYSTHALQQWTEQIIHNKATLTLDGKEVPSETDVRVPASGSVAKSAGTGVVSEDETTMTIPWTVTLNVPKGGLPAGTTIVDDVTRNQWNSDTNTNQWMTRSQITNWATNLYWKDSDGNDLGGTNYYTPPATQVIFKASDGNTYTYEQISQNDQGAFDNLTYSFFRIEFNDNVIPPAGATKLTFTYSTTVNLAQTNNGQNKFYNYVKAEDRESGAEYTYNKPFVVKMDGNGNTDATSVSNEGSLTWKIKATVGKGYKKLTLTDTLPEQVTLESLQITGWMSASLSMDENGSITGTDSNGQYKVSGKYQGNVITLYIEPLSDAAEAVLQDGAVFNVIVNCKVNNPSSDLGTLILTNEVAMSLQDVSGTDTPIDSSKQTQKWTYDRQVVDKSGKWNNSSRIMDYTIILNPDSKTLAGNGETLTLVDTMSYTNQVWLSWPFDGSIAYSISADLMQSSVKLYNAVWNTETQQWEQGTEVTGWSWTYETKTGEYSWNSNQATNTITATGIPDGKPLMLVYSYRVSSNVPDSIFVDGKGELNVTFDLKFSNEAKLEGKTYSDSSSSNSWKWEHSSSSAGVTTDKSYTFYKVEAGNYNVSLAGATFSVYKYDTISKAYEETVFKTYTTDSSGSFRITRQEKNSDGNVTFTYDYNTLYKVVETSPPAGYWMPDGVNTYYFYFSSTEDTEHALPGSDILAGAVDLSSEAKTVYVENVKNTTEISVEKVWLDEKGNSIAAPAGPITINLYQRTTPTSGSGGGNISGNGEPVKVTATAKENTSVTQSKITANAITVGSTIRVKVEIGYAIPSDWTWRPAISVTGMELGTVAGWTLVDSSASGHSTYSFEGVVTGNISIEFSDESEGNIASIIVTTLSQATTPAEPDSGDTTTEEIYKTITLSQDGNWSHTFTDLPLKGSVNGNTVSYYYYFQEAEVPAGYTVSYSNGSTGVQSGTVTITNTATTSTPTNLTVTKVWQDSSGAVLNAPDTDDLSATVQLYRVESNSGALVRDDGVENPVILNKGNSFTYSWQNLPEGTYYVVETAPATGYDISYSLGETTSAEGSTVTTGADGSITVTNKRQQPKTTSIMVKKEWTDASGNALPALADSISYELWRKTESSETGEKVGDTTFTLTAENSWTYTHENLPAEDDSGKAYTYYVVETTTGYQVSYSTDGTNFGAVQSSGSAASGAISKGTITIRNSYETVDIPVSKQWFLGETSLSADYPLAQIEYKLYRKTASDETGVQVGETTFVLSGTNNWTYTHEKLPAKDSSGNAYTYYVEETTTGGFTTAYETAENGTLVIKNTVPTTSISVEKKWLNADGSDLTLTEGSVTFDLYRIESAAQPQQAVIADGQNGTKVNTDPLTIIPSNWTATVDNLPTMGTSNGQRVYYTYYVVETAVDGYDATYAANGDTNTITITNTKQPETASITVKKVWGTGTDGYPDSITFNLYQLASGETSTDDKTPILSGLTVKSQSADEEEKDGYAVTYGDWTTTISNLPKTGTSSNNQTVTYVYVVKETTTGYDVTYSNNDGITSGEITITNTKTTIPSGTSLKVEKKWVDAEGNVFTPASDSNLSINLNLYQVAVSNSSGTGVSYQYTSNGSAVVGSGTLSDVQVGSTVQVTVTMTYDCTHWQPTITLTGMTALTDGSWTHSSNSVYTILATIAESSVVVNVGDSVGNFSVSVVGQATAASLSDSDTRSDVPATEGIIYGSVTLNSSNGWKHTFTGLPLTGTAEDGTTQVSYYYYLKEVSVPAGYTVSYSNDEFAVQSGTITITNSQTTTPSGTQLKVKKEWKDANGDDLTTTSGYSVVVQLHQVATTIKDGTSSEKTTSLGGQNGWNNYTLTDDQLASNPRIRVTYTTDANYYNWGYGAISKYVNGEWQQITELRVASGTAGTYSDTVELPTDSNLFALNFWGSYTPEGGTEITYATLNSVDLIETVITGGTTTTVVNENFMSGTLDSNGNWEYTWSNLPANDGANTTYTYYVEEVSVTNGSEANFADLFNVTVDHGDGKHTVGPSGTVTVTNTLKSTFTLPETGGGGAKPYTLGGLLLCFTAGALLLYSHSRRGKEDATSS